MFWDRVKEKQAALPELSEKPGRISNANLLWTATNSFSWMPDMSM